MRTVGFGTIRLVERSICIVDKGRKAGERELVLSFPMCMPMIVIIIIVSKADTNRVFI